MQARVPSVFDRRVGTHPGRRREPAVRERIDAERSPPASAGGYYQPVDRRLTEHERVRAFAAPTEPPARWSRRYRRLPQVEEQRTRIPARPCLSACRLSGSGASSRPALSSTTAKTCKIEKKPPFRTILNRNLYSGSNYRTRTLRRGVTAGLSSDTCDGRRGSSLHHPVRPIAGPWTCRKTQVRRRPHAASRRLGRARGERIGGP
jgi:hypothetical protein